MSNEIDFLKNGNPLLTVDIDPVVVGPKAKAEDEKFARERIRKAIDIGVGALTSAKDLFEGTEDSKALRALSGLIVSIAAAADKLVAIHKDDPGQRTRRQEEIPDAPGEKKIWLGSPKDLQEFLDREED